MEGSQMTGINLRVATLKNAKLKNCNLRGATLAGTDLEVSHWSPVNSQSPTIYTKFLEKQRRAGEIVQEIRCLLYTKQIPCIIYGPLGKPASPDWKKKKNIQVVGW